MLHTEDDWTIKSKSSSVSVPYIQISTCCFPEQLHTDTRGAYHLGPERANKIVTITMINRESSAMIANISSGFSVIVLFSHVCSRHYVKARERYCDPRDG